MLQRQWRRPLTAFVYICLVQENTFNPVKEIIPHAVILCLVAEAAAGLKVVQIIGAALGERNDVIDRVFTQRDKSAADAAMAFCAVIDLIALLLCEHTPLRLCGRDCFGGTSPA